MAEGDVTQATDSPLPPQLMQLMGMMGGGQPQAGVPIAPGPSAIPPTSPVQPQGGAPATGGTDLASMVSQVSNLPQYQQASGRLEQIGSQEQDIQKKMAAMQPPKMGWTPDIRHGEGVKGFFHNLGQALITLGAATRPGQDVQGVVYGPGIRQYGAQQKSLGDQLAALKDQEAIPTEELRATTGLTQAAGLANYRGQMGAAAASRADSMKERADAYVQSVKNQHDNMVHNWNFKQAATDEKVRHNIVDEAQAAANEAGRNYRSLHKDATTEDVAQVMSGTRTQIANEAAARDPSVKSWLFNALGVDVPQVQSAPSPEFRPTPKAGTAAAPQGSAPARPKGVPADAQWDAKTKTWYK
jgi:hypothetical protein